MKRADFTRSIVCFVAAIQLVSCNKLDDLFGHHNNGGGGGTTNPVLKEMIIGDRHYMFYYDSGKNVDSVVVNDPSIHYVYQVHHHGARIDSVTLFQDGSILSVNTDFKYDSRGNITEYSYYYRPDVQAPPNVFRFTYDAQNRIIRANNVIFPNNVELTYDANNNLIKSAPDLRNPGNAYALFTYDNKLNPLYYVKNLFAIFVEEPFIWEYTFSQHNSLTKQLSNGATAVFTNEYNNKDQLVIKSLNFEIWAGATSFTFSYYN